MAPPVYWMRHGTSHGNVGTVLQSLARRGDADAAAALPLAQRRATASDGELTALGHDQGRRAGEFLGRFVLRGAPPILVASSLPRAIETAAAVRRGLGTPEETIHVVPFVQEFRNTARTPDEVRAFATRHHLRHVGTAFYPVGADRTRVDAEPFVTTILPALRRAHPGRPVLVVSHGNFMQEHVTGGVLPHNTQVYDATQNGRSVYRPAEDTFRLGGGTRIRKGLELGLLRGGGPRGEKGGRRRGNGEAGQEGLLIHGGNKTLSESDSETESETESETKRSAAATPPT